mgnify:CR=1 FL=1
MKDEEEIKEKILSLLKEKGEPKGLAVYHIQYLLRMNYYIARRLVQELYKEKKIIKIPIVTYRYKLKDAR